MNKRGESIEQIIKGAIGLIIIIPIMIALFGALNQISSQSQNNEIQKIAAETDYKIQNISSERDIYKSEAEFYKEKYNSLINTSITKEDISLIQEDLDIVKSEIRNVQNNTGIVNQNVINLYNTRNNYVYFTVSIVLNFTLLSLAILDWTIFNFAFSEGVINKLRRLLNKIKDFIKGLFRRNEGTKKTVIQNNVGESK